MAASDELARLDLNSDSSTDTEMGIPKLPSYLPKTYVDHLFPRGKKPVWQSSQNITEQVIKRINPEKAKAHRYPPAYWQYNFRDAIIYALGVGCNAKRDLRYLYENHEKFVPLSTYVVGSGLQATRFLEWPGVEFALDRSVHGEQYIESFKPLPADGKLRSEARVIDVLDKKTGTLLISEVTTYDDLTNDKLSVQQFSVFQLGAGGFGGARANPEEVKVAVVPNRAPDAIIEEQISANQHLLYRLGGLDLNPLHAEPEFAQNAGFKEPILHGLCTLGFAFRHLLLNWAGNDTTKFEALKLRFSSPVIPGQTLRTESWLEGGRVVFQTKVKENSKIVLSNGWISFTETPEKPEHLEGLSVSS